MFVSDKKNKTGNACLVCPANRHHRYHFLQSLVESDKTDTLHVIQNKFSFNYSLKRNRTNFVLFPPFLCFELLSWRILWMKCFTISCLVNASHHSSNYRQLHNNAVQNVSSIFRMCCIITIVHVSAKSALSHDFSKCSNVTNAIHKYFF